MDQLVERLRYLEGEVEPDRLPIVRVEIGDPDFDWGSLGVCTNCGYPGIDAGQDSDCRYSTDGPEGLHMQTFTERGFVAFHLDEADVCRDSLAHAALDTRMVNGAVSLGAVGGIAGGILGGINGLFTGALAFGSFGGLIGVFTPKGTRQDFDLEED